METTTTQPTTGPLEHLLRSAISAHSGTSFSPEKRGRQMIDDYEGLLKADLEQIKEAAGEVKQQYQSRFIKFLSAYIGSRGRIVSPMISGPSNFPVRRMEKYRNWEDNAYRRFNEFRDKAINGILKQIQRDKSPEQKSAEAWASIQKTILSSTATIIAIDKGINTYSARPLFVSSITGFITRLAKNGQTEHVKKAIELIRQLNKDNIKPIITEKNSIFSLVDVAQAAEEIKTDAANRENVEYIFEGGKVVLNYEIERVQIIHDQKPTRQQLDELKAKGLNKYNFSPSNLAWQRKLTRAAIYDTNQLLNINIPY